MKLSRLFLIITTLFLSAYLMGCATEDKAGVTGACEINLNLPIGNDPTKTSTKKSFCYVNTSENNCKGYLKKSKELAGSQAKLTSKFVPNAGCSEEGRSGECKSSLLTFYTYKIGVSDIDNGIVKTLKGAEGEAGKCETEMSGVWKDLPSTK